LEEIYLVRHGSVDNPQGVRYHRRPGFPLSQRGVQEAWQTARFLAGRNIEVIYHSPLERCVQTAKTIASVLDTGLVESEQINEWDENESIRDVAARMSTFWMMLHGELHERVAVVSHRDPLRALMIGLAGGKLSEIYQPDSFALEPAGVWLLRPGPKGTTFENLFTPRVNSF